MDDKLEKIEEYLESLEEYFFSSLSAATTDLPTIHEAVNRLWVDISRYGPGMPAFPEMHLPSLGDFQVPPPPPTPPPARHLSWLSGSAKWVGLHPWKASGIAIGVVGAGLLVGYHTYSPRRRSNYRVRMQNTDRRQAVVVLGGDTPLALPLILELEKRGYIVIASVSTPEAVLELEQKCEGYVRALVLDPHEPATIPVFLRSLASTMSRKFPITAAGDPFASPSSLPYIHSVICLLTLPNTPSKHAPLENISLRNTYLPYLSATHIAPLQVIQALMPILRTGAARSHDKGKKSIIVCLPAMEARIGLPFSAMQAMSAASTLRAVEVLRREIHVSSLTDKTEAMKNIRVIVADVGALDVVPSITMSPEGAFKAMEDWSPSEKVTYGPAFVSISHGIPPPPVSHWGAFPSLFKGRQVYGVPRRPTDVRVFVDKIVAEIRGDRLSIFGIGFGIGRFRTWIRGERLVIGAGANTYRMASHLPSFILDTLLNIPHILISIKNRLLPIEPFVRPSPHIPSPPAQAPMAPNISSNQVTDHVETPESTSEADVESNVDSVDSSWISLQGQEEGGGD